MMRPLRVLLLGLFVLPTAVAAAFGVTAAPAGAQHALGGSGPYDPSVPTPESVLGYELGETFTPHHLLTRYLETLARSSDRITLDTVATTWEGRPVLLATATSAALQARIDEVRAGARRLADPRGASADELQRLVASQPTVVWLGYTVHGDEASGVEAAMATLYQLAAGQDAETTSILENVVTLIDPVQNPDGHDRHVFQVAWDRGRFGPDPYPRAVVHDHDWHGARTNHYLFDLNRDWVVHAHPETRGRLDVFRSWYPHVAADLHEMGANSTYFFAPPQQPVNANIHPLVRKGWDVFAAGNAEAFAERGWGFFTREGFDEFFPGYGPSWPLYSGAVGMTYEQASSEGGAIQRDDGTILTLLEAARHHYTASMATLRTAARTRGERVADYLAFRQAAVRDPVGSDMRTIVFEADADGRAAALAEVLARHGVEIVRTTGDVRLRRATAYGAREPAAARIPAGSYVVDLAQPQGVLARTLLEPDPALDPEFLAEELARREAGMGDRFYDMTGWALPFLYRVRAWHTPEDVGPVSEGPAGALATEVAPPAVAGYAYAFEPGSEASYRLLVRLLGEEIRVRHAPEPFRIGSADFPRGAFIVAVHRNPELDEAALHERVRDHAAATGAEVVALQTARVDEGTDLGSNTVEPIPAPRVALAAGPDVSAYSYGATWYAFDQRLSLPVTRIELDDLVRVLDDFDVIVLPSAYGLGQALGERGAEALTEWVRGGGTLITLDAATAWAASDEGPLRLRTWRPGDGERWSSVPGAILRARVDTTSALVAGIAEDEIPVMLFGRTLFEAPEDTRPGEVVIRYEPDPERLRLAGYLWPEQPERVAGAPYLWTERLGSGRVIAFTGDPNFRAMWPGLLPLFANAVLLGPTM